MNVISMPRFKVIKPMAWDDMLKHIEQCGRICYKSEDRISADSSKKFVRNIIDRGHESVIEHIGFTVIFTVDRGITHEQVRHRLIGCSQESTRYCNYTNGKFGNEITVMSIHDGIQLDFAMDKLSQASKDKILDTWANAMEDAERHYMTMIELGATPQIARSVLPQSTKADIAITANLREWRHIFRVRSGRGAHPQMREVMIPLLMQVAKECPVVFGDIEPDWESAKRLGFDVDREKAWRGMQ